MIPQASTSQVSTGGVVNTPRGFTIQATAKAFYQLSSGLYSDKITAVIRELSCNAYDAHVASGKEEMSFEVHLPNTFEPFFRVSDFGPGLSEEDMYEIYTSFFNSTKTGSNTYIGALGLGSKSPFSYTDSFTVTSYYAGTKKVYSAFLTEEGMPSIVKMGEEAASNDRTGLEVQFSVKANDFYEFSNKAVVVYRYFPVVPTITGKSLQVNPPKYTLKGDGWGIREAGGDSRAIQGVVAYSMSELSHKHSALNPMLSIGLDLFFPIGDLEVAASRETLSMNKLTTANLVAKLEKVKHELLAEMKADVETSATYWEACCKVHQFKRNGALTQLVRSSIFKWNNREVNDWIEAKAEAYQAINMKTFQVSGYRRTISEGYGSGFAIAPGELNQIILDVEPRGAKSLVRQYFKNKEICQNPPRNIVVLRVNNEDPNGAAQLALLLEHLGHPETTLSSTIKALVPKKVRVAGTKIERELFQTLNLSSNNQWSSAWLPATDDQLDADIKYYVPVSRNKPVCLSGSSYSSDLISAVAAFKTLGFMEPDASLFAATPAMLRAIAKDPDNVDSWVSIDELIQNFKVSITPDIKELITGVTFGHVDLPNYKIPVLATIPGVEPYKNHPFVEWYQGLIQLASKTDSFKRSADAYRIINGTFTNIDLSSSSLTAKIRSEFQKFQKAYPFLHFNQWNSDKTHLVQMLRYMTAMDLLDEFEAEANKEK